MASATGGGQTPSLGHSQLWLEWFMKILVTILLTAMFVFALATTWVDYVQPQLDQAARPKIEKPSAVAEAPVVRKRIRKAAAPIDPELLPVPGDEATHADHEDPKPKTSPAETAAVLSQKMDEVKQHEANLAARQETLRMIYDDIRSELSMVDEMRKQTSSELAEAERRVRDVAQRKPAATTKVTRPSTSARIADENTTIRGEALFIRRLVDEGKMVTAVAVLKSMKGRDAASVLESLSTLDSKLADRLADSVSAGGDEPVRR